MVLCCRRNGLVTPWKGLKMNDNDQDRIWIPSSGECWETVVRYGPRTTGKDYTSLPEVFQRLGRNHDIEVGGHWVPLTEWKAIWVFAADEARKELKAIKAAGNSLQ
jgi:hypothetical protein